MKKPNILLITTDQQRYDTICAMGYEHMITPNLDQIAREGCCYPNAYSPNPACLPARHNIITGLPAKFHGFDDNYFDKNARTIPHALPTFAQILSDSGYDTIAVGKMHFQPCRRHNGFTKMELMEEIPRHLEDDEYAIYLREKGYKDIQSIHGVRHVLYMMPQRSLLPEEYHGSSWVAERSIHHLKQNDGKRPFMLWSSFIAPHPPLDVPEKWADLYKDVKLPSVKKTITPISELAEEQRDTTDYPSEKYLQRARELYMAAISFVDYNIGKIIQQLKDMGEYDNTLIIFTSDHGELLGDYGTYQKFLPYDGSARIPFIARYPERIEAGSKDERFVDLNDLLPTFLDVAKVTYPNPEILPGESILVKHGAKDRTVQYLEYSHGNKRWVSIRNRRYKYNYYYGGAKEELFDMLQDPDETKNLLFENSSYGIRNIADELKEQLIAYEKKYGLDGCVENNQFVLFDDYKKVFRRENNPPKFTKYEKYHHISLEDEVKLAIKQEEVVNINEMDLTFYKEKGYLDLDLLKRE